MKRFAAIIATTLLPVAAAAQTTGVLATKRPITWGMIFALLFLMLGPIKLLGPFAIAASLGGRMLDNFPIPVLVLQTAAGLTLSLAALQAVMQKYSAAHPP